MRSYIISQIVSELIGKQYTPVIDMAIRMFELDKAIKLSDRQIQQLACKAQSLYDHYRSEVFEGNGNPYTEEERVMIMAEYLHGRDVSLYVSIMDEVG